MSFGSEKKFRDSDPFHVRIVHESVVDEKPGLYFMSDNVDFQVSLELMKEIVAWVEGGAVRPSSGKV